jgi:hypothetical protein
LTASQRQQLSLSADHLGDTQPPAGLGQATRRAVEAAIDRSLISTFRVVGILCACMAASGGLLAFFTVEDRPPADRY